MEPRQTLNLFITHVDKEGPFLKVWGQAEKNSSIYVEQFLLGAATQFDKGIGKLPGDCLKVGTLVCAKYKDNKYYRARVVSEEYLPNFFVEVFFIDYGNKDIVPTDNIRTLQGFPAAFISIPPLASGFIFAEAHCTGGEWNDVIFDAIAKELKYREVQCAIQLQAIRYYLVKLYISGEDVGAILISKGLMQPIPTQVQQAVLLSMSVQKKPAVPVVAAPPTTSNEINTYKACSLEPGQQYAVYVSFVNDGPTHFSVQLQQSEQMLAKLMKEINEINVRLLEDVPLPGTICLARCQEDGNICRAVVTNEVDNQFKVFYVDFGNYEILPLESLYQIPFKYVLPKVMAIRLSLNGIEKSSVTIDMLVAFKKFVDNRLLHMKVLPSPPVKKYIIPKCDIWDPETSVTALEVIKRAALHSYPEPLQLNKGFTQSIKVSYVFSCNRFYVQLVSKEAELNKLMEDLQTSCQTAEPVEPADIKIGLPCCALFETDQLFYRSQIVDVVDKDKVKVKYIDFGNEEEVPIGLLRQIEGELLTVLRPQAIECCLTGYQNMPVDEERDGHWEELILEQQFTMKVIEMIEKKASVELIDGNNYKAASLLLEKLAAAKSQVSPLLVQDGNKIEHRKASADSQRNDFRQDRWQERKPREGRDNWDNNRSNWGDNNRQSSERSGEKSWRQDNTQDRDNFRNNDKNSNEDGSWRQNKGFRDDRSNKRPNENNWNNRNGSSGDAWNEKSPKSNGNAGDSWSNPPTDSWSAAPSEAPAQTAGDTSWGSRKENGEDFRTPKDRDNNFGGRNKRFDNDRGDRGDRGDRPKRDGFREDGFKKREFRKDGSDGGSDQSFKKGPRTSSRNDQRGGKYNDRQNSSFVSSVAEDSWNVSALTTPLNAAPSTATFEQQNVVGTEAAVIISWFHDPTHFYLQLQSTQPEFRTLMEEIQEFYKGRKPETSVVGAPVIGLFPEDKVLYRAKVLEIFGGNYKVLYVDFGNIETIDKVWPVEKKFMTMPAQALCCGLDGVAPNGESWPEPSSFGKFFQKESYMARFLYEHDSRTYIELWDGENNIASQLFQENLATPVAPPQQPSQVEISYLLGQQFRVVLKSVNSLSDIIAALECGLALNCKMHNLDFATEIYEDVLKACLEQTLIVYVDNILEGNILEVTFYENDGNKLVVIVPDEGAIDTVEPLCPALILYSTLSGFVVHAEEKAVFVQPHEHTDAIAVLLEKMFEAYESEVLDAPIIPEEDLLYAIRSPDTNWYRGRCLSFDDNNVTVIYVDYGNTETVPFSELRELKPEFTVPHMLCVQVTLTSGKPQDYLEKDVTATICYGESGWEGVCEIFANSAAVADNTQMQQDTLTESAVLEVCEENAVVEQHVEKVPESTADQVVEHEIAEAVQSQPESTRTQVYVSHIDSPSQFYVQFEASIPALEELQLSMQTAVNDWPVLEKVSVGVFCAAPFSLDQQWYRAEVLDCDDDITTVRFVDFGNTDVISNGTTEIKTLPSNLLSLALYATRCSLRLKPVEEEWNQAAIELFESYANLEKVEAEFIIQDEKNNYVDLYADGQNVAELLTKANYAVSCDIVTESKPTCFISHLNSPSEFWVQMETCVGELEWIAEQLSGAESFPELEDVSPGTLCAALFPDDEMWYRARILSNTIAGIELLFIDYGNSCISSSLRQLPEDVLVTPPLAQKCCIQKPEGIPYWTTEAQNKFSELSAEGQTIFTLKKITTDETAVVELLLNGENVVSMILPVTEDGYVKNVESLCKFSIEKNGELSKDHFALEPLPGMAWNKESVQKFKEQFPEDTLFQIEMISDGTLRLYYNGCDIRPNIGGEKISNLTNTQVGIDLEPENEEILDNEPFTKTNSEVTINENGLSNVETQMAECFDIPVESNSQSCDTQISETIKAVDIVTKAVEETNKIIVDSIESVEASEEALIEKFLNRATLDKTVPTENDEVSEEALVKKLLNRATLDNTGPTENVKASEEILIEEFPNGCALDNTVPRKDEYWQKTVEVVVTQSKKVENVSNIVDNTNTYATESDSKSVEATSTELEGKPDKTSEETFEAQIKANVNNEQIIKPQVPTNLDLATDVEATKVGEKSFENNSDDVNVTEEQIQDGKKIKQDTETLLGSTLINVSDIKTEIVDDTVSIEETPNVASKDTDLEVQNVVNKNSSPLTLTENEVEKNETRDDTIIDINNSNERTEQVIGKRNIGNTSEPINDETLGFNSISTLTKLDVEINQTKETLIVIGSDAHTDEGQFVNETTIGSIGEPIDEKIEVEISHTIDTLLNTNNIDKSTDEETFFCETNIENTSECVHSQTQKENQDCENSLKETKLDAEKNQTVNTIIDNNDDKQNDETQLNIESTSEPINDDIIGISKITKIDFETNHTEGTLTLINNDDKQTNEAEFIKKTNIGGTSKPIDNKVVGSNLTTLNEIKIETSQTDELEFICEKNIENMCEPMDKTILGNFKDSQIAIENNQNFENRFKEIKLDVETSQTVETLIVTNNSEGTDKAQFISQTNIKKTTESSQDYGIIFNKTKTNVETNQTVQTLIEIKNSDQEIDEAQFMNKTNVENTIEPINIILGYYKDSPMQLEKVCENSLKGTAINVEKKQTVETLTETNNSAQETDELHLITETNNESINNPIDNKIVGFNLLLTLSEENVQIPQKLLESSNSNEKSYEAQLIQSNIENTSQPIENILQDHCKDSKSHIENNLCGEDSFEETDGGQIGVLDSEQNTETQIENLDFEKTEHGSEALSEELNLTNVCEVKTEKTFGDEARESEEFDGPDLDVQDVFKSNSNPNIEILELESEEVVEKPISRPLSRLSHDDRILPATLSRPQSPMPTSPDVTTSEPNYIS